MSARFLLFVAGAMLISGCSSSGNSVPSKNDSHRFSSVHFVPALDGNIDFRFCDNCQALTEKTVATSDEETNRPVAAIPIPEPVNQVVAAEPVVKSVEQIKASADVAVITPVEATSAKQHDTVLPASAPSPESLLPPVAVDPPALVAAPVVEPGPEKAEVVAVVEDQPAVPKKTVVIYFLHNNSKLDSAAITTLNAVLKELAGRKDVTEIEAHGYTDNLGNQNDQNFNQKLSMARAQSVSDFIHSGGIKAKVLSFAEGDCCFVTDNASEEARALNRRVEIIF